MKKKILAISICVCICFALLAIPVFAEVTTTAETNRNVIPVLLDSGVSSYTVDLGSLDFGSAGTSGGVSSYVAWLTSIGAVSRETAVGDNIRWRYTSGNSYDSGGSIYAYDGKVYAFNAYNSPYIVGWISQGSVTVPSALGLSSAQALPSPTSVTVVGEDGLVEQLAGEVFSVGGGLISFVMSHWIVLLPVVAFLVILCIGAIRKIIKGV